MQNQFLRNWCLTINNPEETDEQFLDCLKDLAEKHHLKYGVFQREIGDKMNTPHFQIYIEFTISKRFETIKSLFPRAHIEARRGTKKQARDYCMKEKKEIKEGDEVEFVTRISGPHEYGEFVDSGERSDLTDIMDDIEQDLDEIELSRKHHGKYARHQNWADRYREKIIHKKFGKIRRLDLEVTYIYGKAGVGKTRHVMDKYGDENVYRITDYGGNLFDNYNNEDVIIFEEFREQVRIDIMLNYLDVYPLRLPARYNNKIACYTKVFIITNLPLSAQYNKVQENHPETWQAFLRRIHKVYDFDLSKENPVGKMTGLEQKPLTQLQSVEDNEELPF